MLICCLISGPPVSVVDYEFPLASWFPGKVMSLNDSGAQYGSLATAASPFFQIGKPNMIIMFKHFSFGSDILQVNTIQKVAYFVFGKTRSVFVRISNAI